MQEKCKFLFETCKNALQMQEKTINIKYFCKKAKYILLFLKSCGTITKIIDFLMGVF
jgi:hypothetical protein